MLRRSSASKLPNNLHQAAIDNNLAALKANTPKPMTADNVAAIIDGDVSFHLSLTQEDHHGHLPIECAAARGHFIAFEYLLNHYLRLKINLDDTLLITIQSYKNFLMDKNIEQKMTTYNFSLSPLFPHGKFNTGNWADLNFRRIIERLIRQFPQSVHTVDKYNHSALYYAVELYIHGITSKSQRTQNIAIKLVQALLRNGASFNHPTGHTAKQLAFENKVLVQLDEIEQKLKSATPPPGFKKL